MRKAHIMSEQTPAVDSLVHCHTLPRNVEKTTFPLRIDVPTRDRAATIAEQLYGISTASLIRQLLRALDAMSETERAKLTEDLRDNRFGLKGSAYRLRAVRNR